MKQLVSILIYALMLASSATAQTSVYAASSPHLAGNFTFGICTNGAGTCEITSVQARGVTANTMVYSILTGVHERVATVSTPNLIVKLGTLAQAGTSTTLSSTTGAGGLGGSVIASPASHPNWSLAFVMRGVYAANTAGWEPVATLSLGYTFQNATVSTPRAARAGLHWEPWVHRFVHVFRPEVD
jgi:hypothetical protein